MKTLFWRLNGKLGLRITTHAQPVNISIPRDLWERINSNPGLEWTGHNGLYQGPHSARINAELLGMLSDVKMTYTLLLGYGAEITAGAVRDVYKDMITGRYSFDPVGLAKCMRERSVKRIRMSTITLLNWHLENSVRCVDSTRGQRRKLIRNYEKFLKDEKLGDIQAEQFTIAVMNRFLDWMRHRKLKDSYINEHITYLKSALTAGCNRDYVAENVLAGYEFRFHRDEHTLYLTMEQLQWLEETDFTKPVPPMPGARIPRHHSYPGPWYGEKMQEAVNLFILCCYTAFHYCDRESLSEKDVLRRGETMWIDKVRRKTKRFNARATVKLSPKAREIIDHYGGIDHLPKMEYMTNMGYLFRVGKLMGIPFKLATGHARNTFAHLCLNHWGFDLESTAAMMGLLSTDTIRRYGKVRLERIDRKVHWPE